MRLSIVHLNSGHAVALFFLAALLLQAPAFAEMVLIEENAGNAGIRLQSQSRSGVEIHYGMDRFDFESLEVDGEQMQIVLLPGVFLPNNAGAPNLPGLSRAVAIPEGASVSLEVVSAQTRTYSNIELAPAPPIQKEDDDSPLSYEKDPSIYNRDANYPENHVLVSEPTDMRGVDIVNIGVTPFQYNPVTKELTVYTELDIRIEFVGGNGEFGENRLRNRYWEPLLRDHLLNYESLPHVDFDLPRGNREGYEYVIICPDNAEFIPWADTLKTWRNLQGISTEFYTTSETGTSHTQIEAWLNNAYNTWDIPPVAFLILGDYPGSGDDRDSGVTSPTWSYYCVSDNIYADVSGNNLPDMAHGRITARGADDLELMIGHMLSYEREPVTNPDFYEHPLIAGGWQTERWFILCTEICYGYQANVLGKDPVREYAIYSGSPGYTWSTNPNTYMVVNYFGPSGLGYIPADPSHLTDWGGNAVGVIDAVNAGAYMVLHRDHGSVFSWGEPYFGIGHISYFTTDMYPFVFTINCLTGKYNHGGQCFTEAWHRFEHGAVGLVAASEVSYSFVNDTFIWGMMDSMWPDFDPGYGDNDNTGPADLRTAFAHSSGKWYLQASSWPYNPQHKIYTHHLFHHHGDAFITMYSEMPIDLTVVHDDFLALGEETFDIQADAGAVIALTVDGEIIGVADATGSMQSVPIEPQNEEGTLRITVTKANYFRYDVQIPIESGSIVVLPDGSGDYRTIQAAIEAASDGGLVELGDGVFIGDGNRDVDFLGKAVTVQAQSGNAQDCIIDCEASALEPHRGFIFQTGEGATSILKNVTIINGYAPPTPQEAGGAILFDGSSPTITGCIFTENAGVDAGALSCNASSPTLTSCTFDLNLASDAGGAVLCDAASTPRMTNCSFTGNVSDGNGGALACIGGSSPILVIAAFTGNEALNGGAIYLENESNPSMTYCTFEGNATQVDLDGFGGAVMSTASSPALMNCRFVSNAADSVGGAMYFSEGTPTLDRCIYAGNAAQLGGGIGFANCSPDVGKCTLYGNEAGVGGGLYLIEGSSFAVDNTIIAFGTAGEALYADPATSCEALLSCCDLFGNAGGDWVGGLEEQLGVNGNFSLDPFFCDAPAGDFHLWNYSPCSQAGCGQIGAEGVGCWDPQDIGASEVLSSLQLDRCQPNPFKDQTRIAYRIPSTGDGAHAALEIFDATGRLVQTLVDNTQSAGEHLVIWDGTDQQGTRMPSGIYYAQLRVNEASLAKRLVLMR